METEIMRKELREAIDNGDDALVEAIYEMLKDYETDEITEEEIKELDELRRKRISGESKTFTWEEAKEIIQQRKLLK